MSEETALRERICAIGHSLFLRGLTAGSSGNISARMADGGWLMTPTNVALGALDPARLARFDAEGRHTGGDPATKEAFLHFAMYRARAKSGAVVHLHSHHATAVSLLEGLDPASALPPLTAYQVMRVGRLALAPYHPPGDPALADAVWLLAERHHAILLANHGPVVAGTTLEAAQYAIEELEEAARLYLTLEGRRIRPLDAAAVADLERRFPSG